MTTGKDGPDTGEQEGGRGATDSEGRSAARRGEKLSDFLRALPAGTRSKDDIDRQVEEERDAW